MTIYEVTDPTATEMERLFWSLVPVVAEQAKVTEADAIYHMRRAWGDRVKAIRTHQAVDFRDDGRSAAWRVRLIVLRVGPEGQEEIWADSDAGARFDDRQIAPGSTVVYGLPAVADWVRELVMQCHAGETLDGIGADALTNKIKSLRVALSNAGGETVWRIRYTVTPPVVAAPVVPDGLAPRPEGVSLLRSARQSAAKLQHFRANVYVQREESPRGK